MKKWLIVLVACLLFAVDGNFANFFPGHLFSAYGLAAPRFLFVLSCLSPFITMRKRPWFTLPFSG